MTPNERRTADLKIIRARVAIARADQRLSQARHARLADTDPGTLNKFLNGGDIRVSTFIRICEAAGLTVSLQPKLRDTA